MILVMWFHGVALIRIEEIEMRRALVLEGSALIEDFESALTARRPATPPVPAGEHG
jgi:hypothetical protein